MWRWGWPPRRSPPSWVLEPPVRTEAACGEAASRWGWRGRRCHVTWPESGPGSPMKRWSLGWTCQHKEGRRRERAEGLERERSANRTWKYREVKKQNKTGLTYATVISAEVLWLRLKGLHCSTSKPNPWHLYPFMFIDMTVSGSSPTFSTLKLFLIAKSGLLLRRPAKEQVTLKTLVCSG